MSKEFFHFDEFSGATEYTDFDPITGQCHITTEQDIQPLLDLNASYRNEGIKHVNGLSFRHYASVPMVVILELRKKGIDFYNRDHLKRVLQEIEINYPYLKVDTMKHGVA
jgi:hypothetical protein